MYVPRDFATSKATFGGIWDYNLYVSVLWVNKLSTPSIYALIDLSLFD